MNKSRHKSLVVVPNLDYVSSAVKRRSGRQERLRDRRSFLDVGFLVGRVLILVFCLLVRAVFLSLHEYHGLDHHPQTLRRGSVTKLM